MKKVIQWTLSGILMLILLSSGLMKLSGLPEAEEMAAAVGGAGNLLFLGVLELIIAILFIIPRTKVVGLLLMIAYFGGAMATHLISGDSILVPSFIQTLVWFALFMIVPELKESLIQKRITSTNS
ncbi:MAG: DoxX family protein [Chitinophagales bacterium]|nr:DoxX family protein [Chitinophagales bacterium]